MSGIIWTRPAVQDLDRLLTFLKGKNPEAARKAALRIRKAASDLAASPHMGKPMPDDTGRRELATSFGRKGYILRYRLDADDQVVIIRVWHFPEQRTP